MNEEYPNFLVSIYNNKHSGRLPERYFYKHINNDMYVRIASVNSTEDSNCFHNRRFTHHGIANIIDPTIKAVESYDTIEELTIKYFDILL